MSALDFFLNYSNAIIAVSNIVLIIFIFVQLRDARKPIIYTKIISSKKRVIDRPTVLESGTLYLAIVNNSKNIAKSINVDYQFDFNSHSIKVKEKELGHLNPEEATTILLKSKAIREKYPELFEKITEGDYTKMIPKETLKIDLTVIISYNPIIGALFKYALEDNYVIEWSSRESHPNFKDHPIFNCWNKRNGEYYIEKTSKQTVS